MLIEQYFTICLGNNRNEIYIHIYLLRYMRRRISICSLDLQYFENNNYKVSVRCVELQDILRIQRETVNNQL